VAAYAIPTTIPASRVPTQYSASLLVYCV
jgi:hypothetical protein